MIDRRAILLSGLALAGCGGTLPKLPVEIKLSPEIQAVIDDAKAVITKVESLGTGVKGTIGSLIDKGKVLVSDLSSGKGDTKVIVNDIISTLGSVAALLPPPYGTIALAIETLLPLIGGAVGIRTVARRTGMSPVQARMILRS